MQSNMIFPGQTLRLQIQLHFGMFDFVDDRGTTMHVGSGLQILFSQLCDGSHD